MLASQIYELIEEHCPSNLASDWDNVGILIGSRNKQVRKILIALDASEQIVNQAVEDNVDMLITHHPLIFSGMKNILSDDFIGKRVMALIENKIVYAAFHTNFDVAVMGELVADKLALTNQEVFEVTLNETDNIKGFGRVGILKRQFLLKDLCDLVKKELQIDNVKVYGDLNRNIQKVSLLPGAGKSEIPLAVQNKSDVYITGDVDHHSGIDAVAQDVAVIDAGHYGMEYCFVEYIKDFLENKSKDKLEIITEKRQNPFNII